MTRTDLIMLRVAVVLAILFAPAAAFAASINFNPTAAARPHVQFNLPLHIDVKPRVYRDIDVLDPCRDDARVKTTRQRRVCQLRR